MQKPEAQDELDSETRFTHFSRFHSVFRCQGLCVCAVPKHSRAWSKMSALMHVLAGPWTQGRSHALGSADFKKLLSCFAPGSPEQRATKWSGFAQASLSR